MEPLEEIYYDYFRKLARRGVYEYSLVFRHLPNIPIELKLEYGRLYISGANTQITIVESHDVSNIRLDFPRFCSLLKKFEAKLF